MKHSSIVSVVGTLLLVAVSCLLLCLEAVEAQNTNVGTEWTYRFQLGKWYPTEWGHYSPSCSTGSKQSPIDFKQVAPDWNLRPLHTIWGVVKAYSLTITPKRTMRVYINDAKPSLFDRNAKLSGSSEYEYVLDYVDIVSPSAHTFGGSHRDVEVMYVHSLVPTLGALANASNASDTTNAAPTTAAPAAAAADADPSAKNGADSAGNRDAGATISPTYIVSTTFVTSQGGKNDFFTSLLHNLDDAAEADKQTAMANARYVEAIAKNATMDNDILRDTVGSYTNDYTRHLDLARLRPDIRDYYTYQGSMQRPPCAEAVTWAVFTEPSVLGKDELAVIRKLMNLSDAVDPATGVVEGNNRPMASVPSPDTTGSGGGLAVTNSHGATRFKDFIGDAILLAEPRSHTVAENMDAITWTAVAASVAAVVVSFLSLRVAHA